jgi:hypothetical protein
MTSHHHFLSFTSLWQWQREMQSPFWVESALQLSVFDEKIGRLPMVTSLTNNGMYCMVCSLFALPSRFAPSNDCDYYFWLDCAHLRFGLVPLCRNRAFWFEFPRLWSSRFETRRVEKSGVLLMCMLVLLLFMYVCESWQSQSRYIRSGERIFSPLFLSSVSLFLFFIL